ARARAPVRQRPIRSYGRGAGELLAVSTRSSRGQVRSVAQLATVEGNSDRYVSSLLPLAFLAPDIVDAIAAGRQPPALTAHRLIRSMELPIGWGAQKQLLGFS